MSVWPLWRSARQKDACDRQACDGHQDVCQYLKNVQTRTVRKRTHDRGGDDKQHARPTGDESRSDERDAE